MLANRKLVEYDPKKFIINFAGVPLNRGIADGTFFSVARYEPTWRVEQGSDGEFARVRTNNFRGLASVTMQQGAVLNSVMSALQIADERTGLGVGFFFVKDFSGFSLYSSPRAWIKGMPEESFSTAAGPRTWEIELAPLIMFPGGNKEV